MSRLRSPFGIRDPISFTNEGTDQAATLFASYDTVPMPGDMSDVRATSDAVVDVARP